MGGMDVRRGRRLRAAALVCAVAAIHALFPGLARAERPEDVPNPLAATGKYVGDGAGVLGPAYVGLIDEVCQTLKSATGAELAVVTVGDLGGTTVEDFAERLFKRLGVGEKGKDNGLLLLMSRDDRAVRFEVGYGLEGVLPDARAGRLLDEYAVPFLAKDEFGRGLHAVVKAAAELVAASSGVTLGVSDPPSWPEQPRPVRATGVGKASLTGPSGKTPRRAPPALPIILGALVLGMTGLWGVSTFRRFGRARSMAGRLRAANGGAGYIVLMWTAAIIGWIVLLVGKGSLFSLLGFALTPVASNAAWRAARRTLRNKASAYRLPCVSCGSPMDLVPEEADDALLAVEEAAEERAGGMDYELWMCPQCGAQERFSVQLKKAGPCPQCSRRTLVRTREVLVAATTSHGGRERVTDACKNPKCGYLKTREKDTPRIVPAASSSSGSGSHFSSSSGSRSSSFGGGRSGGGGASRRF